MMNTIRLWFAPEILSHCIEASLRQNVHSVGHLILKIVKGLSVMYAKLLKLEKMLLDLEFRPYKSKVIFRYACNIIYYTL